MKYIIYTVAILTVCFSISLAAAQDKVVVIPLNTSQINNIGWININPSSATFNNGAYFTTGSGQYAGIRLPDTDSPSFGLGFTLPPDYNKGSDLNIHMVWNIETTGCSVHFQPVALSVARPGRSHLTGSSTTSGLTIVGGSILNASDIVDQPKETLITITSPEAGTDLEGGDSIIFGFMRWPWHPDDNCDGFPMKIHGLSIGYQKK